jgi:hypothetical protein
VIENHEFRVEWGIDREAAFDDERRYARGLLRRQLLGVGIVLALKAALTYAAYELAGWWGVVAIVLLILVVLFVRGTHAVPTDTTR